MTTTTTATRDERCDHYAKSGDACEACGAALPSSCGIDRHEGDGEFCWRCFRRPVTQKDCDDYLEALLVWAGHVVDDWLLGPGDVVRLHPADGVDSLRRFIARRPGVLEDVAVVEKLARGKVTLRWSGSGERTCVSRRWVTTSGALARRAA